MADFDVVVVGGGLGGVAAALAAAESGSSVVLLEKSAWLGGQMSAQGVCTPDESGVNNKTVMDSCGATRSYQAFRKWVRDDYLSLGMRSSPIVTGAPGNNWTSNDGFGVEATRAHKIFEAMLRQAGVDVRYNTQVVNTTVSGRIITGLTIQSSDGSQTAITSKFVLDATETGEMLPLLNLDWRIGAENNGFQGENNGEDAAHPDWIQPITFPFAVEFRPSNQTPTLTEKPDRYDEFVGSFGIFNDTKTMWGNYDGFMTYRRVIDHRLFQASSFPFDVSLINVGSNDYVQGIYPTGDPAQDAQSLASARQLTLCYLYYLQHEAPREPGGSSAGWPEIVPRPDFFIDDFIAPQPYIRESRRINALGWVIIDDIAAPTDGSPVRRAKLFRDSCGVGNYPMDVHSNKPDHCYIATSPFQIRASQLVPQDCGNFLAAGKCLGVTHVTNGAFRLHPQEWNIGESAGVLASFCAQGTAAPADVCGNDGQLVAYQSKLVSRGVPIFWWTDVPVSHPQFAAIQMMGVRGILSGDVATLDFRPSESFTTEDQGYVDTAVGQNLEWPETPLTRAAAAAFIAQQLNLLPA